MLNQAISEEALLVSAFRLGEGIFAIPAVEIQEVVQMGTVTPVHHAAASIVGIRNLRGRIVTVIDLGMLLELGEAQRGPDSRILIVDSEGELMGLLVDRVDDTIFLQREQMSAPPPSMAALSAESLRGVYRCPGGLVTLLDPNVILRSDKKEPASLLRQP